MTQPKEVLQTPGPAQRPEERELNQVLTAIDTTPCHPKDLPAAQIIKGDVQCPLCGNKVPIKRYSRHLAPCVKAQRSPFELSVWSALWKLREGPFCSVIARRGPYKLSDEQLTECCHTVGADPKRLLAEKAAKLVVKAVKEVERPRKRRKGCVPLWVKVVLNALDDGADRAPQEVDGVQSSWKVGQLMKHLKNTAEETKDDLSIPGVTLSLLRLCEMDDAAREAMVKNGEFRRMEGWRACEVDFETVGDVVAKGTGASKANPLVVVFIGVKRDPALAGAPSGNVNDDGRDQLYHGAKDLSHIRNWSEPPAVCVVTGRGSNLTRLVLAPEGLKGEARAQHLRSMGWQGDEEGPALQLSTELLIEIKRLGWGMTMEGKGAVRVKTKGSDLVDMHFTGIPDPVVSIMCDSGDTSGMPSPTKGDPADDDDAGRRGIRRGGGGGKEATKVSAALPSGKEATKASAKEKDAPKAKGDAKVDQRAVRKSSGRKA